MKRGPEEIVPVKRGVTFNTDATSDFLLEDSGLQRRGRELGAMIKTWGKWNYFVTLTCNLKETPGVKGFMEKLRRAFPDDKDHDRAYASHLPVILRLW